MAGKTDKEPALPSRMSASDDAARTLLVVGQRLRKLRVQRGYRQQDIAEIAGISTAMLSLVERGLVSPSLTTLAAMAHGLGISLTDLIAGRGSGEDEPLSRLKDQPVIKTDDGVRRWVLKEDRLRKVDITLNEYAPDIGNSPNGVRHTGYEYGFVIEGELTVEIDRVAYVVGKNDLISLDSTRLHKIWNYKPKTARALWFNLQRDDLGPTYA
ncbi:helix-turn-helix domain-containing protein [Methylobrevis pamukkalensis]|uniref:HTH-type transcriptional regulator PuuR n=1 Tax=Methylobrevis pamukkalensis TaxID=1439726 RepID=A0A1E3H622_9HYPH|nr:helix-turn-helix domain-containing protein [Methylobrevis pamukkalensis]ODN71763.1 HTH-type transcriptional regulator PuuR [Methylobrevis pamukkalensis]